MKKTYLLLISLPNALRNYEIVIGQKPLVSCRVVPCSLLDEGDGEKRERENNDYHSKREKLLLEDTSTVEDRF
jgi:hypothetical protein